MYRISDQTYRVWRYRANGIKPKRRCSREEKLEILEEGYQNGICRVCAAHGIDPGTYYYWKRKFRYTKSPRRLGTPKRFDKEERLAVVKEGEKTSVQAVCAKYGITRQSYRNWRYRAYGSQPKKYLSSEEKLRILEEGYQNGIARTCRAHQISPKNYYNWRHKFGFTKLPRRVFDEKDRLLIVNEAIKSLLRKSCSLGFRATTSNKSWRRTSSLAPARIGSRISNSR